MGRGRGVGSAVPYESGRLPRIARWSYFPTLLNKCVWFTLTVFDVRVNLRILMWGIGTKGYPEVWWKPTLRIFFVIF